MRIFPWLALALWATLLTFWGAVEARALSEAEARRATTCERLDRWQHAAEVSR